MRLAATIIVALASLAFAAPASASWSTPQAFTTQKWATGSAAVNAGGESAVAWMTHGDPSKSPAKHSSVHVELRTAAGHLRHVVLATTAKAAPYGNPVVAIDSHGTATVAWIAGTRVYATYGTLAGRWTAPRFLASGVDSLAIAISPAGEVLLTWLTPLRGPKEISYQQVAWRNAGHAFGAVRTLARPRPLYAEGGPTDGAIPVYDKRGTAYLSAPCDGVVLIAAPHSQQFGNPVNVAAGSAMSFSLSIAPSGQGVASWARARCSGDAAAGPTPGLVYASALNTRRFTPPVKVSEPPQTTTETIAFAPPSGSGSVFWRQPVTSVYVNSTISPSGALTGSTTVEPNSDMPVLTDGGGDVVVGHRWVYGYPYSLYSAVRPAGGRPAEPAPNPNHEAIVAATPVGRAFVTTWDDLDAKNNPTGRWLVSVWRP